MGSADAGKKRLIELAYSIAESCGLPLWCQDEAGPYATKPQPGAHWQPEGQPKRHPHEYLRRGGAKLLTLFRPATGEVRAKGVTSVTNAVLHPWLKEHLLAVLEAEEQAKAAEEEPAPPPQSAEQVKAHEWETWVGWRLSDRYPSLRMMLVWDNLAGHRSAAMRRWLFAHGIMPLYTPLGGSWLNMAESLQRILVRRALAGQDPQSPEPNHRLVGTDGGWLEPGSHPVCVEWQAQRAQAASTAAPPGRLWGSGPHHRKLIAE